jgi:hypothetical protein
MWQNYFLEGGAEINLQKRCPSGHLFLFTILPFRREPGL